NKKRGNLPDNAPATTQAQGLNYLLPSRRESGFHQYFARVENSELSVERARFSRKHATPIRTMVSRCQIDHFAYFPHIRGVAPQARCSRVRMYSVTSEN